MLSEAPASVEEGLALVVWYLAFAQRMVAAGKTSLAVLLTYAAMERYMGLCLRIEYGLDDEHPDYSRVQQQIDPKIFDEAGRKIVGQKYEPRKLSGKLMFANSAQLLATLAPHRLEVKDLGLLQGLSAKRNKCEYEHGFLPRTPAPEDAQKFLAGVKILVGRCCGEQVLENMLGDYRYPGLPY
jgi:hypothetical protein